MRTIEDICSCDCQRWRQVLARHRENLRAFSMYRVCNVISQTFENEEAFVTVFDTGRVKLSLTTTPTKDGERTILKNPDTGEVLVDRFPDFDEPFSSLMSEALKEARLVSLMRKAQVSR